MLCKKHLQTDGSFKPGARRAWPSPQPRALGLSPSLPGAPGRTPGKHTEHSDAVENTRADCRAGVRCCPKIFCSSATSGPPGHPHGHGEGCTGVSEVQVTGSEQHRPMPAC